MDIMSTVKPIQATPELKGKDAIAVLLITSCVIPIIVLIFLVWIVKIIFGVKISVPDINKKKKIEEKTIQTVEDKEKISQNT